MNSKILSNQSRHCKNYLRFLENKIAHDRKQNVKSIQSIIINNTKFYYKK